MDTAFETPFDEWEEKAQDHVRAPLSSCMGNELTRYAHLG